MEWLERSGFDGEGDHARVSLLVEGDTVLARVLWPESDVEVWQTTVLKYHDEGGYYVDGPWFMTCAAPQSYCEIKADRFKCDTLGDIGRAQK